MVNNIICLATELEGRRAANSSDSDAARDNLLHDSLELLSLYVDIDDPEQRRRIIELVREIAAAQ